MAATPMARLPPGYPFTKIWNPVPYRAGITYEPIRNLVFYAMTSTAYDPAAAGIFSIRPTSLQLTRPGCTRPGSSSCSGITGRSGPFRPTTSLGAMYTCPQQLVATLAGEIESKGVEFNVAVRPIDGSSSGVTSR